MDLHELREIFPNCINCGKHCPIDATSCPRGKALAERLLKEYAERGAVDTRRHEAERDAYSAPKVEEAPKLLQALHKGIVRIRRARK